MAESHFNAWDETVDGAAVVALPNGYVFCRIDGDNDRLYFGTEDDGVVGYAPSFLPANTDYTRKHDRWVEDAALGSQIMYAFNDDDRGYVVTGSPGDTEATVVVFDEAWTSPGKYTLDMGYDPTDAEFHYDQIQGLLKFIQAVPTLTTHSYDQGTYPGYADSPGMQVFVGESTLPASVQRYRQVSNVEVYSTTDSAVSVSATTAWHDMYFPVSVTGGYTFTASEYGNQSGWWRYMQPGDAVDDLEWMHDWRVFYSDGTTTRVAALEIRVGVTHSQYTLTGSYATPTAGRGFIHDPDEWFRCSDYEFVKFNATGWDFAYYTSENNPRLKTDVSIAYPFEPDYVLQPESFRVALDGHNPVIVGPVVVSAGKPYLFCLQLRPYEYLDTDPYPFYPALTQSALYGDGATRAFAIQIEQEPLLYDVDPSGLTYRCRLDASRVAVESDVYQPRKFSAAVSLSAWNPVNAESDPVSHLFFVSNDLEDSLIYVDYDDLEPDPDGQSGSENGKLIFDTSVDPDDRITILAQQNPTQDIAVEGDTEADGDVSVLSDYEDEDVLPMHEPQLVFTAAVSIIEDYQNEVLSVVFDSGEHDGSVSAEFNIVFGDVMVAAAMDLSADALVGAEGYSEGTPPTPGTCTDGTYTVTLPEGADPDIPLSYIVDGRLVTVMHNGVVVGAFYLPTPDLDDFCVTVLLSTGDPATDLPDPDVVVTTPTYMVDTSMRSTDVFMVSEGDHEGVVYYGPSVFITADNEVEVMWDFASPDDIEGKRVVWLFGYDNPPIDFNDAALIAASGNGKYLIPVLP